MCSQLKFKNFGELPFETQKKVIEEYYAGLSVKQILKTYDLDIHITKLVKQFPEIVYEDSQCTHCGGTLIAERRSRSLPPITAEDYFCRECNHRPFVKTCNCDNCTEERESERVDAEKEMRNLIDEMHGAFPPVAYEDLCYSDRVFLGAICHHAMDFETKDIVPYTADGARLLTPAEMAVEEICGRLFESHAIVVSSNSPLSAFSMAYFPKYYDETKIHYRLNLASNDNSDEFYDKILYPEPLRIEDIPAAMALWRSIGIMECFEYMCFHAQKYGWVVRFNSKINKIFSMLLDVFAIGQIFNVINYSATRTARYALEKNISLLHASNLFVSICESEGFGQRDKQKAPTCYRRPIELPQSELSYHLANRVLLIGETAFTKCAPQIHELLMNIFDVNSEKQETKEEEYE